MPDKKTRMSKGDLLLNESLEKIRSMRYSLSLFYKILQIARVHSQIENLNVGQLP